MAFSTRTLGTNLTTSLTAFIVGVDDFDISALNPLGATSNAGEQYVALLNNSLRLDPVSKGQFGISKTPPYTTDVGTVRQRVNQPYSRSGYLIIPGRGKIVLKYGDIIAWDAVAGWPIVISADAANNGPYTFINT
jgi:hypothetical protein